MTIIHACLLFPWLALSAKDASAQQPHNRTPWPERVLFDQRESILYARGRDWKAEFSARGLSFIPFLGSRAPHNEPVRFALQEVRVADRILASSTSSAPIRFDSTIHYLRGPVEEVYDTSLEGIEQTIVIRELPLRDEIRVRFAVSTELAARDVDDGVEFTNDRGGVRYRQAIARDAAGRSRVLEAHWSSSAVELDVPADFVRDAALPCSIDPLIEAFQFTSDTIDEFAPDTAVSIDYGHLPARWDVWEIAWSQTDHDVALRSTILGNGQSTSYLIDATSEYWSEPTVAGVDVINIFSKTGGGCLVAASVGDPSNANREIHGRALAFNLGAVQVINGTDAGDKHAPAIAGDTYYGDSPFYYVVWQIDRAGGDKGIQGRAFYDSGVPLSGARDVTSSSGGVDTRPAISKGDGTFDWCIVWERRASATNRDIWARRVAFDGTLVTAEFPVSQAPEDESRPSVSSRSEAAPIFVVACELESGGKHDVFLHVVDGAAAISHTNLTLEEVGPSDAIDRIAPRVDGILASYVVTYKEADVAQSGLHRTWLTSFAIDHSAQVELIESRLPLGGISSAEPSPVATAAGHQLPVVFGREFELVWDEPVPPADQRDVFAAKFDLAATIPWVTTACFGDGSDSPCPCTSNVGTHAGCPSSEGRRGAQLTWTGHPKTSDSRLALHAQRLPPGATALLVQGTHQAHPSLSFGAGLLCAVGGRTDIVARAASGIGTFDYPSQPGDVPIAIAGGVPPSGGLRVYQITYRDPLGFCGSTWNTTNAVVVLWGP
jgi:hypothetical protein